MKFTKFHIVRKLDAADSEVVSGVCRVIRSAAANVPGNLVRETEIDGIDQDTVIIAVGGDGTMLEAMRLAHRLGAYVMGVNLGKVGFLTDFANDDRLAGELMKVFSDPSVFKLEERTGLVYSTEENDLDTQHVAFNEFVISNIYSDKMINYDLTIDDDRAGGHKGNALIVSTPTGSTAYTLSAGGSLIMPSMKVMQIVPVAPMSMTSRPIIVASHHKIEICVDTDGEWSLKCDGQNIRRFASSKCINVRTSPTRVKIIHPTNWSFFEMLTQKLHWRSQ